MTRSALRPLAISPRCGLETRSPTSGLPDTRNQVPKWAWGASCFGSNSTTNYFKIRAPSTKTNIPKLFFYTYELLTTTTEISFISVNFGHTVSPALRYNWRMSSLIPPQPPRQVVRVSPLTDEAGPVQVNRQLRELFREAFDNLGGAAWLVDFATASDANARVFVQAISKLLPASASPTDQAKIVIDIPWLTRDRLAYKEGPMDSDVADVLPKVQEQ